MDTDAAADVAKIKSNPLAIDTRVNWARVSIAEKEIYGVNHHHGFGVDCHCDGCREEKQERITGANKRRMIMISGRPHYVSWYNRAVDICYELGVVNNMWIRDMLDNYLAGGDLEDLQATYVYEITKRIGFPPKP